MNLKVELVNVYRANQGEVRQVATGSWVSLIMSGFRLWELPEHGISLDGEEPFLCIVPKGTSIHFQTAHGRENWVAFLKESAFCPAKEQGRALLDGTQLQLPMAMLIDGSSAESLRMEFMKMREACASPLERDSLMASLRLASIFKSILEKEYPHDSDSPAIALRKRLDNDSDWSLDMKGLAKECGYSADHVRRLFKREYGICPHKYRSRRRMSKAMELLTKTHMGMKEVSDHLGFRHLTHFSTAFRSCYGFSPASAKESHLAWPGSIV